MLSASVILSAPGLPAGTARAEILPLCGAAGPPPGPIQHVIVVMLENRSYKQVIGNSSAPYQTSLASQCGSALAMFGATHWSAANYLALSAGEYPASSPNGCGSISACADPSASLYTQLDSAGLTWAGYMESMPSACDPSSASPYKIGHNPILFYPGIPATECAANDVGVTDLTASSGPFFNALQNQTLPSFSLVSPNQDNDGDLTSLSAIETWLSAFIPLVQQSPSYQAGQTLVIVTYDEGTGADLTVGEDCTNESLDMPVTNGVSAHQDSCHIPLFVLYPYTPAGSDPTFFDLYSITRTVEDLFGLPYLAHAGDAQTASLVGHFGIPGPGANGSPSPSPSPSPTTTSPLPSPSPSPTTTSPSPSPSPSTSCPPTTAGLTELSGNLSLESSQTGWTGTYNSTSSVTRAQPTGGSYDGTWALQVSPTSGSSGSAGATNAKPLWVPGPPGTATVAGATYTGSAFVQASVAGESVSLQIRELTPAGHKVSSLTTTITLSDTGWHKVTSTYTAKNTGDLLKYSLYATNFASSAQYFYADCLSLQTSA